MMQIGYLKTSARIALRGHYQVPVLAMLINIAVVMAAESLVGRLSNGGKGSGLIALAAGFVFCILFYAFKAGLVKILLKILRNEKETGGDIFYGFRFNTDGYLYFGLIKTAMILIYFGILYLMLPSDNGMTRFALIVILVWGIAGGIALIYASLTLAMVMPLLADGREHSIVAAVKKSAVMMRGMKGKLFLLYLSFILWLIPCLFTAGIGLIWVAIYVVEAKMKFYLELGLG